jgi:hypothetical protein
VGERGIRLANGRASNDAAAVIVFLKQVVGLILCRNNYCFVLVTTAGVVVCRIAW